eukprot:scaffold22268_cov123-Isochrysis_galbana.AAC.4
MSKRPRSASQRHTHTHWQVFCHLGERTEPRKVACGGSRQAENHGSARRTRRVVSYGATKLSATPLTTPVPSMPRRVVGRPATTHHFGGCLMPSGGGGDSLRGCFSWSKFFFFTGPAMLCATMGKYYPLAQLSIVWLHNCAQHACKQKFIIHRTSQAWSSNRCAGKV